MLASKPHTPSFVIHTLCFMLPSCPTILPAKFCPPLFHPAPFAPYTLSPCFSGWEVWQGVESCPCHGGEWHGLAAGAGRVGAGVCQEGGGSGHANSIQQGRGQNAETSVWQAQIFVDWGENFKEQNAYERYWHFWLIEVNICIGNLKRYDQHIVNIVMNESLLQSACHEWLGGKC